MNILQCRAKNNTKCQKVLNLFESNVFSTRNTIHLPVCIENLTSCRVVDNFPDFLKGLDEKCLLQVNMILDNNLICFKTRAADQDCGLLIVFFIVFRSGLRC